MKYLNFLFILFANLIFAQQIQVSGHLKDTQGTPLSFAYITFEDKNKLSNFTEFYTESDGSFSVNLNSGDYIISIQPANGGIITLTKSFAQSTDLGSLTINTQSVALQSITIKGSKPLYHLELDKRVYEMEKDPMAKGLSLSEALNNVPSVQVDSDGSVSVRGNSNLKFLIDGKPSALTGISNVADALKSLPADAVSRVEVITNPSARYDAEGSSGIINIIMKKMTHQGFNANIVASAGYPLQSRLSANMNYKTKQWNVC